MNPIFVCQVSLAIRYHGIIGKMKREQYKNRSNALRAPYEAAKLIWTAVPIEANQACVMEIFEVYNAAQSALFERYCRETVR